MSTETKIKEAHEQSILDTNEGIGKDLNELRIL